MIFGKSLKIPFSSVIWDSEIYLTALFLMIRFDNGHDAKIYLSFLLALVFKFLLLKNE